MIETFWIVSTNHRSTWALTDKGVIVLHSCHISPLISNCHSLTKPAWLIRQTTALDLRGHATLDPNNPPVARHFFFLWHHISESTGIVQEKKKHYFVMLQGALVAVIVPISLLIRSMDSLWETGQPKSSCEYKRSGVICTHGESVLSYMSMYSWTRLMSILSLFPKAPRSWRIRTFLEYCDSHHNDSLFSLKVAWFMSVCFKICMGCLSRLQMICWGRGCTLSFPLCTYAYFSILKSQEPPWKMLQEGCLILARLWCIPLAGWKDMNITDNFLYSL